MRLPDGTILMHGPAPYDPVKAHEYYMRTRKLKGRRRALPFQDLSKIGRSVQTLALKPKTFTVKTAEGKTVKLTGKELNEQRAYLAKRVNEIKRNLAKLNFELKKAMAEAKAKKAKSEAKAKRGPTAAEKSKEARESKQYRQSHKQVLKGKAEKSSATRKSKEDPVAELEAKISQVKGALSAAVAKQRALMAATKNG